MPTPVDPWYAQPDAAAAYRRKYERSFLRRLANRRELALLDSAYERAGVEGTVLDCPCGAGRLVPGLLRRAGRVVAADASAAMVAEARDLLEPWIRSGCVEVLEAAAEALPSPDAHFGAVVCHRLIHHVLDEGHRGRVLAELARVTRPGGALVLSFHDATTPKARGQLRRGRAGRRALLAPEAVRDAAADAGLALEGPVLHLSPRFSRLAVAVLRK